MLIIIIYAHAINVNVSNNNNKNVKPRLFQAQTTMLLIKDYIVCFLTTIFYILSQAQTFTGSEEAKCECVPFYLCKNGNINTNGKGLIDIRMKQEESCYSNIEFCCEKTQIIQSRLVKNLEPLKNVGCGYRNVEIEKTKSNQSQFGEFPWMVAVFHKGENESKHYYKCGGSLIHPRVVLTAAHCVTPAGSYKIRAGEWDSHSTQELYQHQDRDVIQKVVHRRYDTRNLQFDIALLFLNSELDTASHINVVCLPPSGVEISSGTCFVTGWGQKEFDKNETEHILKKIQLSPIPKVECQNRFRKTRLKTRFHLHPSFMCAGGEEGEDACSGDGGGPLVCRIEGEDRFQQVGIVSWGLGCATKGIPGAYADVAFLRNWIDNEINRRNLNTSGYNL
ncbi:phenoloxidase-activating factor 2-like [Tribolium madens]|uniref:phenoloxidase-activating factor 2-like n=1 Tax=Tribolium madens TaxID=41895 RepID=UPI001CF74E75|nr:phenoloxidase-activating factor 2-like [Tribolium madens]